MYKRFLFALVGALCALSVGAASAYFTAELQVPDSVITAGTVSLSSLPASAPLSIEGMAPGVKAKRSMTVVNDGTMSSRVIMTAEKKAGITDFYDALNCQVVHNSENFYNGPLSGLRTTQFSMLPGTERSFDFYVSMPATQTNSLQGDYAKVSLYLNAEQVH